MAVRKLLSDFFIDESGATAIEYGLIAAGLSIAIVSAVRGIGANLNVSFTSIGAAFK